MIWLVPLLLVCIFLLFRFISPFEYRIPPVRVYSGGQETAVEGFQVLLVSPAFQKTYGEFLSFHNEFQTRWREALDTVTSMSEEVGTGASKKGSKTEKTDNERNAVVQKMTTSLGKPFPLLVALPDKVETLEDLERTQLSDRIPSSAQPYLDAMEWMNQSLLQAQKELDRALQGGGIPKLEGFAGDSCAEIATCFKENPELVRQILQAQQEEAVTRLERIQRELMERFEQFQQPRLRSAFELNGRLLVNAKEVQRKAQSGEWINDIPMGRGGKTKEKPVLPPGADALEEMRRSNPKRYAELQKSNSSMFSVKKLLDQINQNLR